MKRRHPDEHEVLRKRLRLIISGSRTIDEAVGHLTDLIVRGVERAEDRALGFTGEPEALYEAFGLDYVRPYLGKIAPAGPPLIDPEHAGAFVKAVMREPSMLLRKPSVWKRLRRWVRNEDKIRFEDAIKNARPTEYDRRRAAHNIGNCGRDECPYCDPNFPLGPPTGGGSAGPP